MARTRSFTLAGEMAEYGIPTGKGMNMHFTRKLDITGVILVGGKSSRMGRDKAFLAVFGQSLLVERVLQVFRNNFARVLLVGDRAERFAGYGLPVLPDIHPGRETPSGESLRVSKRPKPTTFSLPPVTFLFRMSGFSDTSAPRKRLRCGGSHNHPRL